jgi:hypothetical protein
MSRSGLFNFENEPIWLIQDSNSLFFLSRFGRTVSVIRDTQFGIGRTVPATRDTRVRLVVLVYCQARTTPNDLLHPNAATTVDFRVGLYLIYFVWLWLLIGTFRPGPLGRGTVVHYAVLIYTPRAKFKMGKISTKNKVSLKLKTSMKKERSTKTTRSPRRVCNTYCIASEPVREKSKSKYVCL